jgi:hypothetical protein
MKPPKFFQNFKCISDNLAEIEWMLSDCCCFCLSSLCSLSGMYLRISLHGKLLRIAKLGYSLMHLTSQH